MKYRGLSAERRKLLARILSIGKGAITTDDVVQLLGWERERVREFLSSLCRAGWLKRIQQNVYVPVPLESEDPSLTGENELVLANYLFGNCYLGAWTAAGFWGLTDQIFLKTWVFATDHVRKKEQTKGEHTYLLKHIPGAYFYGLHPEWIGQDRIFYSDPHKTIVDFANFVDELGLQSLIDILQVYISSEHKNLEVLIQYMHKAQNRTLFKRLGFLFEKFAPEERSFIAQCQKNISKGPSMLSPKTTCELYLKRWHLRVPKYMEAK